MNRENQNKNITPDQTVGFVDIFCSASVTEQSNVDNLLIPSLERLSGGNNICLHLVDYTGTNELSVKKSQTISVIVHKNNKQRGFGAAHNFLFDQVRPKSFFVIINPDIYCNEGLVDALLSASKKSDDIGIVEARQLPYEHPKGYDAQTMETNWASGACILLNPKFYNDVGGFDEKFWMYCEDVDLSWRAWLSGYRIIHCPEAVAYHYTGGFFEYRDDRFYFEQLWGGVNYLYLSYKYWGNFRLWLSIKNLKRQNLPISLKQAILREFKSRRKMYQRAKGYSMSLQSLKNKIGIVGYNCYK